MVITGWVQMRGKMTWATNWDLWSATRWTDIAPFQLDGVPLLLNRLAALSLAVFFIVITLKFFARRERDATRTADRLRAGNFWKSVAGLAPWLAPPVTAIVALTFMVHGGWEGAAMRKKAHDYWQKNVLTWRDAPVPALAGLDLALDIDPPHRSVKSKGTYTLANLTTAPLRKIPLTGGLDWKDVSWTMNGTSAKPENRAGLYVFTPAAPLAPGDTMKVGWSFAAEEPHGISKNGAGTMEFVLPSSVVLTGFSSA